MSLFMKEAVLERLRKGLYSYSDLDDDEKDSLMRAYCSQDSIIDSIDSCISMKSFAIAELFLKAFRDASLEDVDLRSVRDKFFFKLAEIIYARIESEIKEIYIQECHEFTEKLRAEQ